MNGSFLKTGLKRILFLLIAWLATSGIFVYSENQSWLTNSLRISFDPKLTLLFTNEFRNQEFTFMNHYLANVQSGFQYSLSDNSYIAFLYKRENTNKPDYILNENRYTLETGWNKKLGSTVNFDIRFMTEGRTYENGRAQNHFRFRLKLRFAAQVKVGNYTIKPFIASEPFGDTLSNRVTQNRLYIGTSFPLGQHSTFTLNYIRQDTKNKKTLHILNAGFHLKF
ncbi:MAG: DUF2490 domain-containing protein [Candidatus Aminicenantes bacterium]|nr:DUF2490 domain-containing protein [Candidatus Aminicenantes bacterium]